MEQAIQIHKYYPASSVQEKKALITEFFKQGGKTRIEYIVWATHKLYSIFCRLGVEGYLLARQSDGAVWGKPHNGIGPPRVAKG